MKCIWFQRNKSYLHTLTFRFSTRHPFEKKFRIRIQSDPHFLDWTGPDSTALSKGIITFVLQSKALCWQINFFNRRIRNRIFFLKFGSRSTFIYKSDLKQCFRVQMLLLQKQCNIEHPPPLGIKIYIFCRLLIRLVLNAFI